MDKVVIKKEVFLLLIKNQQINNYSLIKNTNNPLKTPNTFQLKNIKNPNKQQ